MEAMTTSISSNAWRFDSAVPALYVEQGYDDTAYFEPDQHRDGASAARAELSVSAASFCPHQQSIRSK
jgi:hypothetical protein